MTPRTRCDQHQCGVHDVLARRTEVHGARGVLAGPLGDDPPQLRDQRDDRISASSGASAQLGGRHAADLVAHDTDLERRGEIDEPGAGTRSGQCGLGLAQRVEQCPVVGRGDHGDRPEHSVEQLRSRHQRACRRRRTREGTSRSGGRVARACPSDELDPPAGAGEGRVHSARQFGPEELVVLRIDPQRRNPRRPAERGKGANQRILVADVIVGARTAATGEVDRGGKPRRRIGGQRQRREAAGGDADRDHAIGRNVGPATHGLDRRAQIAGRLPGRTQIFASAARAAALGILAAGIAVASAHERPAPQSRAGRIRGLADRIPYGDIGARADPSRGVPWLIKARG